ncbi:Hemin transport system permease protein HmuU [Corynebacterium ciconiae DSM 44920]|uniref:FecCD family ABC transporter permease n=1 Tax=Corynebacterium ciconiae TaxID=227319 RepID=UPI000364D5D5|nr:iron ABC transporter permease [Corynebacterium ciconiae]WKD61276.1 Hemin transport system permease protein HmuU [Corynebacterium ciconiae DSM 44920]
MRRSLTAPHLAAAATHIGVAVIVLLASIVLAAATGPSSIGMRTLLAGLADTLLPHTPQWARGGAEQQGFIIFTQLRLPRVVLGVIVGAALAIAGAAFQAVLRNPLADPYLLGVSSGAGLAVTACIALGVGSGVIASQAMIAGAGFIGGIAAVAATLIVSRSVGRGHDPLVVVLAGVAVGALCNAVQTFLQQAHDTTLRRVYSWMLGHLATSSWLDIAIIAVPIMSCIAVLIALSRYLDALLLGDVESAALGLNPERVRLLVIAVATLCTSCAVAASGLIGFVGLVVPHVVRLIAGTTHQRLLPLTVLYGAAFVVCADTLGRSVLSPAEVPIGVVTAFVGAPFFLVLLRRSRS